MPSNAELQTQITDISAKLGVSADTSGNNAQLAARLKSLQDDQDSAASGGADNSNVTLQTDPNASNPLADVAPATNTGGIPDAENVDANVQDGILPDPNLPLNSGPRHTVIQGKAITTRRGIISDGQEIGVNDFYDENSFNAAVKRGDVVEDK